MAKHHWVTEYFHAPMCPLLCGKRMSIPGDGAKYVCSTHGIKVEFTSEMKGYLHTTGGEPPDDWPWNDPRKR